MSAVRQSRLLPAVGLPELGQRVRVDSSDEREGQTGIVVGTDPGAALSVRIRFDDDMTLNYAAHELSEAADEGAARARLIQDRRRHLMNVRSDLERAQKDVASYTSGLEIAIARAARLTEYVALLKREIEEV